MKNGMALLQKEFNIIIDSRASALLFRYLSNKQKKGNLILPVNICPIVVEVVTISGFNPVFVDIQEENYCINENTILNIINEKEFAGILINHTYGVQYDFNNFFLELKKRWDGFIIEDKCLCKPILKSNNLVDLTLFSTGYAKYSELEYGGGLALVKNFYDLESEIKNVVLNNGTELKINQIPVINEKYLQDIQKDISVVDEHKNKLNKIYNTAFSNVSLGSQFTDWRYCILISNKVCFLEDIFKNNLFASTHYKPLSEDRSSFPVAWKLYDNVVNLFNDKYFNDNMAYQVVQLYNNYIKTHE